MTTRSDRLLNNRPFVFMWREEQSQGWLKNDPTVAYPAENGCVACATER